jgi:hypothetical protein
MNQAQFMRQFNESHREQFNPELFQRENQDMIDVIHKILLSCEADKYYTLKLINFKVITNYEEIYNTLRAHEESRRRKNSKAENTYDFINIKDTDIILIKVVWFIKHNGIERIETDEGTKEVLDPQKNLEVLIALPRYVKHYYFRLSGNYYNTTYQIVDGSTYNNANARQSKVDTNTLKTNFSPIRIFRSFRDLVDVNTKETIKLTEYNSIIFKNTVNAYHYLLAFLGLYGLSQFLDINCVHVTKEPFVDPEYYCFKKHNLYISIPKICYPDPMVQAYVVALYTGINKDTTINDIFDIRFWLINLGAAFKNASVEKGLFQLDSIDSIYDLLTKEQLHLPEEDKKDIYCIFRWMLREFSNIRLKENVDVRTKRVRIADYIGQLYATNLNKGIHRISDLGKKVTLKKIEQAVYTQPFYILHNVSSPTMTNLISYRDLVNDNDATAALKYTYKGISGLGEDGSSIQPMYRYIDPSHVGILDLDSSSVSDPGMSGMICPMANVYGTSFSEYDEPSTWKEQYGNLQKEWKKNAIQPLIFDKEPAKPDYYAIRNKIVEEDLELTKIIAPIYNEDPNIVYTACGAALEKEEKKQESNLSLFVLKED